MKELLKSLLVTLLTTVIALLSAEAAFRVVTGKRVFALAQYRAANIVYDEFPKNVMAYDPLLGWRMKNGIRLPGYNTIDYGIRRNSANDDHVRSGGVLVSGASFTFGSEVTDEESWPAQLESLIGRPVVNAGIGAFAFDQIAMRAEELIPIVRPQVLIIDLVQDNIVDAGYSYHGYPKPYFTVENGRLVLQNYPVPRYEPRIDPYEPLKNALSYSLMVDRVMATYFPDAWYSSMTQNFIRADNDEVQVSCLLLQRLKKEADDNGVRLLITMQYGGGAITSTPAPNGNVRLVENCATRMGIQLVDEFASLKSLFRERPDEFKSLYIVEAGGVFGHKSPAGNLAVAKMVAAALEEPAPVVIPPVADRQLQELERGGGVLLSADDLSSLFASSSIAKLEPLASGGYRVVATGGNTDHYLAAPIPSVNGRLTFSIEASASGSSHLRLQLLGYQSDRDIIGVLGDFDFRKASAGAQRVGLVENIGAGIQPTNDGWYRIWISGKLPPDSTKGSILVQIVSDREEYTFTPDGDSIKIRNVTVERASWPSKQQVNAINSNAH
jgi:hypothetical protein